jgi:hypothetical protein
MGAIAWRVLGTGSAVLAASVAQKGLTAAWRAATGAEPPTSPEHPDTDWVEAVAWAVLSAVVIGVARLAATRGAARYYRRSTGQLPRPLRKAT